MATILLTTALKSLWNVSHYLPEGFAETAEYRLLNPRTFGSTAKKAEGSGKQIEQNQGERRRNRASSEPLIEATGL